ncbi:unnamed protein product [Ectocarpus sp. 4 AP-2014]
MYAMYGICKDERPNAENTIDAESPTRAAFHPRERRRKETKEGGPQEAVAHHTVAKHVKGVCSAEKESAVRYRKRKQETHPTLVPTSNKLGLWQLRGLAKRAPRSGHPHVGYYSTTLHTIAAYCCRFIPMSQQQCSSAC